MLYLKQIYKCFECRPVALQSGGIPGGEEMGKDQTKAAGERTGQGAGHLLASVISLVGREVFRK